MRCQDELHGLAQRLESLPHLQDLLRQLHHLRGGRRRGQGGARTLGNSRAPLHSLPPPGPSPTACRSLSSVSVFLASLGPRGTVSRPFSVDSKMGLLAWVSEETTQSSGMCPS